MPLNCCKDNTVDDSTYQMAPTKDGSRVDNTSNDEEEDLDAFIKKKDHRSILHRLKSMQLGEMSRSKGKRTVFHSLLKNATNGHQILIQKLDECVTRTAEDENDPESAIQVDLSPLLEGDNDNQVEIIKDMLDFKDNTAARDLLFHPVIQTFLEIKWIKIKNIFFFNFLFYFLFLLSYSSYLANIFYREPKKRLTLSEIQVESDGRVFFPGDQSFLQAQTQSSQNNYENANGTWNHVFYECWRAGGTPSFTCCAEIVLFISIIILALQEVLQAYALGPRRYFREFENWLEITVLLLALLGLAFQTQMMTVQWISAFGICLAYLELIFLMGRYPFLGGSLSLMFYSITRHLIRSLSNFLVLIIGFAFGFFIIHNGKESDNFENPLKAIAKTLTMVLGEFDFNDIYDAHSDDLYSRTFTMFLLIGLAIMGSLVLVNLIVALIVSDISMLHKEARLQELINKAQHIVYIENIYSYIFCTCSKKYICVPSKVLICGHGMCHCPCKRLPDTIVSALTKILERRRISKIVNAVLEAKDASAATPMNQLFGTILVMFRQKGFFRPGDSGDADILVNLIESSIDSFK